ncbi:MAG TPA: GNAT family N-acetyltransferase [bacterium]|nr:GNAT family N-acetyltransferase [bacterium]
MRIRRFESGDLPGTVDLHNRVYPYWPIDEECVRWKRRGQSVLDYRETFVAEVSGRLIAHLELTSRREHFLQPGLFLLEMAIEKAHRDGVVRERLWEIVAARLSLLRWAKLDIGCDEDDGTTFEWLENLGFRLESRDCTWRLELKGYRNPDDRDEVLARVLSAGYTLENFAVLEDPTKLRRLWALHEAVASDYPGPNTYRRQPFDAWERKRTDSPAVRKDAALVARRGDEFVGMTELGFRAGSAGPAYVVTTGVLREHRGRGLATALKYLSAEWARDEGVPALLTGNHFGNEPILSINRRMGFQAQPDWLCWTLSNPEATAGGGFFQLKKPTHEGRP